MRGLGCKVRRAEHVGIDVGLELALNHMLLVYFQIMRDFGV